jgi:hypothetical protein
MKNKNLQLLFLGIFSFILFIFLVFAATFYSLNAGNSQDIEEWGVCRYVVNNGVQGIFIPTNTPSEWSSFINNPPIGVSTSTSCSIECYFDSDCYDLYPYCTDWMECYTGDCCSDYGGVDCPKAC